MNEVTTLTNGNARVHHKDSGYVDKMLLCAKTLAERANVALGDVVVFYPRHLGDHNIWKTIQRKPSLEKYKGLTICTTTSLRENCMAFLIKDVEAHKTPANAYFVKVKRPRKKDLDVKLNPEPVYTAEESNLGEEIHE
jgi:hypothetical protein